MSDSPQDLDLPKVVKEEVERTKKDQSEAKESKPKKIAPNNLDFEL